MRTFLAIDITAEIQHELDRTMDKLKAQLPDGSVRWMDPDSIHLTIKFLGDVSPSELDAVLSKTKEVAEAGQSMELVVGDFGVFPSFDRPRVLWVGIDESTGALEQVKVSLEQEMEALGFEPERRSFTPHLTLGRVQRDLDRPQRQRLASELKRVEVPRLGRMAADELTLFKSELKPSGAEYTALERWPLGGEH